MIKKVIVGLSFILLLSGVAAAQAYNTGIGLRGGFSNGITIKHFIKHDTAIEGIVETRWRGLNLTGLYEIHNKSFTVEELSWYYGVGGHIGFWDGSHVNWVNDNNAYTVVGIDGILGLEYSFVEIPICISADWKPTFNLIGNSDFWGDGFAISIRYTF